MRANGRLVALFTPDDMPEDGGLDLYYPSRRQNPAPVRALIDDLRKADD